MPARRITDATIARMVEMRERGKTYGQIALACGCSTGAVQWRLLQQGVDGPRARKLSNAIREPATFRRGNHVLRHFTPDEDRQILDLEQKGLSLATIARQLGRRRVSILGRLMTLARRAERQAEEAAG